MATLYQNIIDAVKMVGIAGVDNAGAATYRAQIIPATMLEHSRVVMVTSSDGTQHMVLETYSGNDIVASREVKPEDSKALIYIAENMLSMHRDRQVILDAASSMGLSNRPGDVSFTAGGYIFSYTVVSSVSGAPVFSNFKVQGNRPVNGQFPVRSLGNSPSFTAEEMNALLSVMDGRKDDIMSRSKTLSDLLGEDSRPVIRALPFEELHRKEKGELFRSLTKFTNMLFDMTERSFVNIDDHEKAKNIETLNTERSYRVIEIAKTSSFEEDESEVDFTTDVTLRFKTMNMWDDNEITSKEYEFNEDSPKELIEAAVQSIVTDCFRMGHGSKEDLEGVIDSYIENNREKTAESEDTRKGARSLDARSAEGKLAMHRDRMLQNIRVSLTAGGGLIDANLLAQSFSRPYIKSAAACLLLDATARCYNTAVYLKKSDMKRRGLSPMSGEVPVFIQYDTIEVYMREPHKRSTLSLKEYNALPESRRQDYALESKTIIEAAYNVDQLDIRTDEVYKDIIGCDFAGAKASADMTPEGAQQLQKTLLGMNSSDDVLENELYRSLVSNAAGVDYKPSVQATKTILEKLDTLGDDAGAYVEQTVGRAHVKAMESIKEVLPKNMYPSVNLDKELHLDNGNGIK